ncbi:hypothetical protein EI94DRAFT_1814103 [Lactarius quietus]|nr:hypothetical protein EI94DRAFT_1814103 [Lactarius quietus]
MTTASPLNTPVTGHASLSSEFQSVSNGTDIPEETSPLLQPKHAPRRAISERWKSARSSFLDDNFGLFIVAAAEFFVFAMNATVKLLNNLEEPVPILEIILFRGTITCFFSIAYMYWKRIPDPFLGPKGVRTLLFLRALSGFLGIYGLYSSVQYLSLSDVTVLTFITPILTGLSGAVLLKEPISVRVALAGSFGAAIGLQYETAGRGSLALYPTIIPALVFEFTVLHTAPSPLSSIGTLLILSSAIYTTLTKESNIKLTTDCSFKHQPHGAPPSDCDSYLEA